MPLSKREQDVLERLMAKKDEPARPAVGKSISIHVDLSDEAQVAQAKKYGFLEDDEDMFEDEEEESDNGTPDETPKRRGFFGEQ